MKRAHIALALLLCTLICQPAAALITTYGKEPLHASSWVKGLDQVVNHPSRVSGMIGPFGPSGRFEFSGDATTFNEVLKIYARVSQPVRILYLTPQAEPVPAAQNWTYELSINHEGQGFMHLEISRAADLETLKVPEEVKVESL